MPKLSKLPLIATMLVGSCAHAPITSQPTNNQSTADQSDTDKIDIDDVKKKMIQSLGAEEEGVELIDNGTKYRVVKCRESSFNEAISRKLAIAAARSELGKHTNHLVGFEERYSHKNINIGKRRKHITCVLMTMPRRTQHR